MIRVAVSGAAGKMGATTCEAVEGADDLELVGRADPALERRWPTSSATQTSSWTSRLRMRRPTTFAPACEAGVHAVVGTSGWDFEPLRAAAERGQDGANVFVAPNFAIGAVLMIELSKQVVEHMPECEIIELHRAEKLDAPSGTAKHTARAIEEAGGASTRSTPCGFPASSPIRRSSSAARARR